MAGSGPLPLDEFAERIAEMTAARLQRVVDGRPLYSPRTLAERLDMSERTVREMLARGTIPSFTVGVGGGTQRRVRPEDVDAYLDARRAAEEEDSR
jgi:excisionase family DNA binding protein